MIHGDDVGATSASHDSLPNKETKMNPSHQPNRREFIGNSALAATAGWAESPATQRLAIQRIRAQAGNEHRIGAITEPSDG